MSNNENKISKKARTPGASGTGPVRSQRATLARRQTKRATPTSKKPTTLTLVQAATAATPQELALELIRTWKPNKRLPEAFKHWDEIASAVRGVLLQLEYKHELQAKHYLIALSRHTAKRHSAGHVINGVNLLLSQDALEATFGLNGSVQTRKGNKKRELEIVRKIRAVIIPELFEQKAALVYGRKTAPARYTDTELSKFFAQSRQHSKKNDKHFHALLLLSLGAGLSGIELSNARGSDLISTPWGLVIITKGLSSGGNRGERIVPILARYEDELSKLAKEFGDNLFLGLSSTGGIREPNKVFPSHKSNFSFQTGRARANWTRTLLENNVSYISLRQAGVAVASEGFLFALAKDIKQSTQNYITQVRCGAKTFDQSKHSHLLKLAQAE